MKKAVKQAVSYCLGLLLLAFGVTFSIKSNLGVSPINSIPYVLSLITGLEQGVLTTSVFCVFILMQIILLRKDFKPINFLQIVFSSLFGYFVTFSNSIWTFQAPSSYFFKLVLLVISMYCVAVGLMFYLAADIVPMPAEGTMIAIQLKTGIEFSRIKIMFDTAMVIVAGILSLVCFKELQGVREGTLIAAIGIGKILGMLRKKYQKTIEDFVHNL